MGRGYVKVNQHQKYLLGEGWKCDKSPTGAHHWREHSHGVFYCKYCYEAKKMPYTFQEAMDGNTTISLMGDGKPNTRLELRGRVKED